MRESGYTYGSKRSLGYLSAAIEWAANSGQPERWEEFWKDPSTRSYYFIGKDNIPFHSIIWPAMIMGYGNGLNLPYDVPANEFLKPRKQKIFHQPELGSVGSGLFGPL